MEAEETGIRMWNEWFGSKKWGVCFCFLESVCISSMKTQLINAWLFSHALKMIFVCVCVCVFFAGSYLKKASKQIKHKFTKQRDKMFKFASHLVCVIFTTSGVLKEQGGRSILCCAIWGRGSGSEWQEGAVEPSHPGQNGRQLLLAWHSGLVRHAAGCPRLLLLGVWWRSSASWQSLCW